MQRGADFRLRLVARAAGKRHRIQDDTDDQQFWSKRFQAGGMRPLACLFATIPKTKRSTRDRHGNDFRSNEPGRTDESCTQRATMNGKFESSSNNQDESDMNRLYSVLAARSVARTRLRVKNPIMISGYNGNRVCGARSCAGGFTPNPAEGLGCPSLSIYHSQSVMQKLLPALGRPETCSRDPAASAPGAT